MLLLLAVNGVPEFIREFRRVARIIGKIAYLQKSNRQSAVSRLLDDRRFGQIRRFGFQPGLLKDFGEIR